MRILIYILVVFILWTVGGLLGMPVVPSIETNYFINESGRPLADDHIVTKTDNEITEIDIPYNCSDNQQCLDFSFESSNGKHVLTVANFKITIKNNEGKEIEQLSTALSWIGDDGGWNHGSSEPEKLSISNYEITKPEKDNYSSPNTRVLIRTVFDLSRESNFSMNIKADYFVDSVQRQIDKTFDLKKSKKFTLNQFRVHLSN